MSATNENMHRELTSWAAQRAVATAKEAKCRLLAMMVDKYAMNGYSSQGCEKDETETQIDQIRRRIEGGRPHSTSTRVSILQMSADHRTLMHTMYAYLICNDCSRTCVVITAKHSEKWFDWDKMWQITNALEPKLKFSETQPGEEGSDAALPTDSFASERTFNTNR